MAAVAISVTKRKKLEDGRQHVSATLVFGDGSTAYPAGGILLAKGSLGCPQGVDELHFVDASNGNTNLFKFDLANLKVRIFVETAGTYAEMSGTIPSLTAKVAVIGL
jgi:hypothetical protein